MVENELATHQGQLCAHLGVARMKRWAMVLNAKPLDAVLFLLKKNAMVHINRWHRQWEQHQQVLRIVRPSAFTKQLIRRSCWNQISVEQITLALKENSWRMSSQLRSHLEQRVLSCFGTQLVEDINNKQKNSKSLIKGTEKTCLNLYRRPETSYAAAITGDVGNGVHRFDTVDLTSPVTRTTFECQEDWFSQPKHDSFNMKGIVSYTQNTAWHSPTSASSGASAADLELVDYCMTKVALTDLVHTHTSVHASFVLHCFACAWCCLFLLCCALHRLSCSPHASTTYT